VKDIAWGYLKQYAQPLLLPGTEPRGVERDTLAGLARSASKDDDFGTDLDAIVKVGDGLVRQSKTAG
jgi:hypothetical protein